MLNQFQDVFKYFQKNDVRYLVIGGIASILHGIPRATFDLDILIDPTIITQLSAKDVAKLANWLEDYQAQLWDKQIEDDLEAGRLDALLTKVEKEYEARLCTSFGVNTLGR